MNPQTERLVLEALASLPDESPQWRALAAVKDAVLDQLLDAIEDERVGGDEKLQLAGKVGGVREFWRALTTLRDKARGTNP